MPDHGETSVLLHHTDSDHSDDESDNVEEAIDSSSEEDQPKGQSRDQPGQSQPQQPTEVTWVRPRDRVLEEKDAEHEVGPKSKSASVGQTVTQSWTLLKSMLNDLFQVATTSDICILLIGSVFAIIHGMTFPFIAVLFGSMTNSFINQAVLGYNNETRGSYNTTVDPFNGTELFDDSNPANLVPPQVGSVFDLINKVVLETFTEHEALTREQFLGNVHLAGILFLWLAIVILVSSFLQVLCWEWVAANQKFRLRESVIKRMLRQDLLWFHVHDIGELLGDIFGQVGRLREAIGFRFGSIVESCAMFVMSSLIAISISWRLALVFLSPIPFIIFKMLILGQKIAAASRKGDGLWDNADTIAMQFLCSSDTVLAYNKQVYCTIKFGSKLESAIDELMQKHNLAAMGRGVLAILMYGSYAAAFWYACHLLLQGKISAGEIYTIFLAITMGSAGITNIINSVSVIGTAYGSARVLKEFGHPLPQLDCFSTKGKRHKLEGEVTFSKVSFGYKGRHKVLKDLSFKIEAGKTVGILAGVGEGKTTLANLILGVYSPTRGKVKIDGVNIKKLNFKTLRQNVGIALQRPQLCAIRINDNIKVLRRYLSAEDIKWARFVVDVPEELPEGYEDARQLPKHNQQKINIARSLAADPAILVFDEAFSQLLPFERDIVRARVLDWREGMTTIILTYDILSLEKEEVEKIYILKDGRILPGNIGTHEELMETGGVGNIYKIMHDSATALQAQKGEMDVHLELDSRHKSAAGDQIPFGPTPDSPVGIIELFGLSTTFTMFGFGLLGVVLTGVQLAAFAFCFVEMFGTFSRTGDELVYGGKFWAGMIAIIAIVAGASTWLRTLCMSAASLYTMLKIRTTAFGSIIRRPKYYYIEKGFRTSPVTLGNTMVNRAPFIRSVLEEHLPQGLSTAVTLICVGGIVSVLVWQIGLILILGVYSFLVLLAILQYKMQRSGETKCCDADAKAADFIMTTVEIIELIQTHAMQRNCLESYRRAVSPAWQDAHEQAFAFAVLFGLSEAIFFVFFGIAFLYGCYLIDVDVIQPERLFKMFFSMAFCVISFNEILAMMPNFAKAMCSLQIISDLVREDEKLMSSMDALNDEGDDVPEGEGEIKFCSVHFEYLKEHEVFKGLDFIIPGGKTTVITGPPSFGGSTLLAMIQRFYDPKDGDIELDQRSIKSLKVAQLRDKIGWVPEQIDFFDGSLARNLRFGSTYSVSEESLKQVLDTVKLRETFENSLKVRRHYKHWGTQSRGTQVLIGIARALISNPKILLLDYPTKSMSAEEEMKVIDVIREIKANRTCVIISDSTLVMGLGDKVTVIKDGVVIEEGTLEALKTVMDGYFQNWLDKS